MDYSQKWMRNQTFIVTFVGCCLIVTCAFLQFREYVVPHAPKAPVASVKDRPLPRKAYGEPMVPIRGLEASVAGANGTTEKRSPK
ncbi:MAG: hypothetical protein SFX74_01075 [Fimbriimonadaceae bacterium]|nr:hypothetical protein [Fimbriimonadaceae bacterium]